MDLHHQFAVPASVQETWEAFNDLQRIGGCLPGATITAVDGDEFTGSVKVKLGPISLQYNGTGSYTERDEAARRVVIVAKGKDKRGNGTASATITAVLAADGTGTSVDVDTDLAITGKPAQFGRGVIQDVSDKLLGQFVDCIKDKLSGSVAAAPSAPTPPTAPTPAAAPTRPAAPSAPASATGGGSAFPRDDSPPAAAATGAPERSELPTAKPPSAERTEPAETDGAAAEAGLPKVSSDAAPRSGAPSDPSSVTSSAPGSGSGSGSGSTAGSASAPGSGPVSGPPAAEIDLMSTVGPVLVKRYAKPVVGALALAVLVFLLRRILS